MNPLLTSVATEATWTFTNNPEVMAILRRASAESARAYSGDIDDLIQEASMFMATRPELINSTPGQIYLQVLRYLNQNFSKPGADIRAATSGRTVEEWELDLGDDFGGLAPDPFAGMAYPEALVATLLEAMWNGWVVRDEFRPDSDMPRARPNPKTSGTILAHKIDIERAWTNAPLTPGERTALRLTIGDGLTNVAAAAGMGLSDWSVGQYAKTGLAKMAAELNQVAE